MILYFKGENLLPTSDVIELANKLQYKEAIIRRYRDAEMIRLYGDGGLAYEQSVFANEFYRDPEAQEMSDEDKGRTKKMLAEDYEFFLVTGWKDEFRPFIIEGRRVYNQCAGYTFHNLMPFFEEHEPKIMQLNATTLLHHPKFFSELDCDELDREMLELILRGIGYEQVRHQFLGRPKKPTHRVLILCNQYKAEAGFIERKSGTQWLEEDNSSAKKYYYQLNKKPATKEELEKVIDLLAQWPKAQKIAINKLSSMPK